MNLYLEERADDSLALYINGDLQFDSRDERIYHESLALPALTLARPEDSAGLKVLICGGGDGLALRECLRFPGVAHVDLVDLSPEVLALARERLASLNERSLEDPRAHVHVADAAEFLTSEARYDVILCDFTVPRRPSDSAVFTREWYERVCQALTPGGVAAINAVSPQATPEAFWCLKKTVHAAGLSCLPYRACIPSFREMGYGAWGFLLAAHKPLTIAHLRALRCPVTTRQTDLSRLWHGAHFSRAERLLERNQPIHTAENNCFLALLLNPVGPGHEKPAEETPQPSLSLAVLNTLSPSPAALGLQEAQEYDLEPLIQAIPVTHVYHTREMIETLARQVAGMVRSLDLRRLLDTLLRRALDLPGEVLKELGRLRDYLKERTGGLETMGAWGLRLFAALVILMTIANAVAPDNAFAKGSMGLGHFSMSRGVSSSFSGSRGFGSTARTGSSFGGNRGTGSSFGAAGRTRTGFFGTPRTLRSVGFRTPTARRGGVIDIYGNSYPSRHFTYYGGNHYYGGSAGSQPANAPVPEQREATFAADDDLLVLDNGDIVVSLSDSAYLLVSGGKVSLYNTVSPNPLLSVYPDPSFFQALTEQLQDQQQTAGDEAAARRDWLSWTAWTRPMFASVRGDREELKNLEDLGHRLNEALSRLGQPPTPPAPDPIAAGSVELFNGAYMLRDGRVAICGAEGKWRYVDGHQIVSTVPGEKTVPCPPELSKALRSVIDKLVLELNGDIKSLDNDLRVLSNDRASLQNDLRQYQDLASLFGSDYDVDYGSDEISASDAISRTTRDLDENNQDTQMTMAERTQNANDLAMLRVYMEYFGK